jgi:hypothetical protein
MGEKIRDLGPIRIGSSELMIELNEGGNSREGRLIHIQNKHFRYLLKEKYFLQMASTVMRSKCEMEYYKQSKLAGLNDKILPSAPFDDTREKETAAFMCRMFDSAGIPYRLLELQKDIITFLINNGSYKSFFELMKSSGSLKKQEHLYSKKYGYNFLYKMRPFELYLKDDIYVEFFFQLPCKSLTPDTWMPLHRSIQERIWDMHTKNEADQPVIDVLDYFIFRLCRAVFEREALTEYDVELMRNNKALIDSSECRELLNEVFFNYTDKLIEHIVNSEYTQIIPSFYSFKDY